MKKIKYYLHLYLGCDVKDEYDDDIKKLHAVSLIDCMLKGKTYHDRKFEEIKLILRPLSDMTEDEWNEIDDAIDLFTDVNGIGMIRDNFLKDGLGDRCGWRLLNDAFIELRKRSVDVDGLIESGLAIDKTTLK